jgi:hypothetical protein
MRSLRSGRGPRTCLCVRAPPTNVPIISRKNSVSLRFFKARTLALGTRWPLKTMSSDSMLLPWPPLKRRDSRFSLAEDAQDVIAIVLPATGCLVLPTVPGMVCAVVDDGLADALPFANGASLAHPLTTGSFGPLPALPRPWPIAIGHVAPTSCGMHFAACLQLMLLPVCRYDSPCCVYRSSVMENLVISCRENGLSGRVYGRDARVSRDKVFEEEDREIVGPREEWGPCCILRPPLLPVHRRWI